MLGTMVPSGGGSSTGPGQEVVRLGRIFDEDAGTYDEVRPTYPSELFDELVRRASLGSGSRVLEIGAGTGQATLELAKRGFEIVALEPGPNLARIATERLRAFPAARVEIQTFEEWDPPTEPFDAVVAATSFHWLDPSSRLSRCAAVLRAGGHLGIISTHHVAGGTTAFFHEVQRCYERYMPGTEPGLRLPSEDALPADPEELLHADAFGRIARLSFAREATYSSDEYTRLLMTYSGHRALHEDARKDLLECIRRLIDGRYAGRITKRYLFRLTLAERARREPTPQ